jgi:membrane associated rhomboid family serine protease
VIPLHDNIPTRRFPVVTVAIVAANVAVFVVELLLPRYGVTPGRLFAGAGLTPYELTHHIDVAPPDYVPVWATIFTSMFLHSGWLHIGFNMLFLWIFGNNVEDAMGRGRFLLFYLLCGVIAAAAQIAVVPNSTAPMVGASGAIAGVLGAYLLLYPRARVLTVIPLLLVFPIVHLPAWLVLIIWFGLQFLQGTLALGSTGVAYFAHVGGFLAGMVLVWLFTVGRRARPASW